MTYTMTRAEELRNDLDNLHFTCRYYIGILAELEQLGKTHTAEFKTAEANVKVLKKNIRRVEAELEKKEENEYMDFMYKRFIDKTDFNHWNNE